MYVFSFLKILWKEPLSKSSVPPHSAGFLPLSLLFFYSHSLSSLSHSLSLFRTISVSVDQLRKTRTPILPWQPLTLPKHVLSPETFRVFEHQAHLAKLHPHKHGTLLTFTCTHWHAETHSK